MTHGSETPDQGDCGDPTGYFLGILGQMLTMVWKLFTNPVVRMFALMIAAPYLAQYWLPEAEAAMFNTVASKAVNIGIAGGIVGFLSTGTIKGAAIGAVTAEAFYAVGGLKQDWGITENAALASDPAAALESAGLHALVGGASSALSGQGFKSGFIAAGIADLVPLSDPNHADTGDLVKTAVAGGFGSVLGGGKFLNGAVTGAMGYLFNHEADEPSGIDTPHGVATQGTDPASLAVRDSLTGDTPLYRIGTTNVSHAAEAQYWSTELPDASKAAEFAQKYGLPAENISDPFATHFIEVGTLKPGTPYITRLAPGVGGNGGGAVEVVVPSNGIQLRMFSIISGPAKLRGLNPAEIYEEELRSGAYH